MTKELLSGAERFRRERFPELRERFRALVEDGQAPHTLFIACSDSRVDPALVTGVGPGELFVVRTPGNLVPPSGSEVGGDGTAAAIEFAVQLLGVSQVVVCGHSHCGAIGALYEPPSGTPHLADWLELARGALPRAAAVAGRPSRDELRRAERRSVALQLDHLLTHGPVGERVERGELTLHGWHYVIEDGRVDAVDRRGGGRAQRAEAS